MQGLYNFLTLISAYRDVLRFSIMALAIIVVAIYLTAAVRNLRAQIQVQKESIKEENLKNVDYDTLEQSKKAAVLRSVVAPDGIDPGPNSYLVVNDGGKDVYVRSLTIVSMPRRDKFANTFADLLNFSDCTSSIFINPIAEETMVHKMDRHITVLGGEYNGAEGDINRQRKLRSQLSDANRFAEEIENGENRFFNVGFLFTLRADSVSELNKNTSKFHSVALSKGITVSSCFAVQPEAFAQNAPFNKATTISSGLIKSDAVKYFTMDKRSVSALYNYTQTSYSHTNGVMLGRDMFTATPVLFDVYDGSHDGYTMVIAGKVGSGKSAMIKMLCSRQLLHGYHFVAIDSQARKGMQEGEYAALAQLADGVNFQLSNTASCVMNPFEVSESTSTVRGENHTIYETRGLDLSDKILMVSNIINTMIHCSGPSEKVFESAVETYINRIVIDNVTKVYRNYGIVDGNPDSLYTEPGNPLAADIDFGTGRPLKKLPTMTDFYKQVLISNKDNKESAMADAYTIILNSLEDYIKELYYSVKSCHFFTAEQYNNLPNGEGNRGKYFLEPKTQNRETVKCIKGVRAYFDGQSTIHIGKDCPFTNIDISQLPDSEKKLARQVAMDFVNESFIKKNSAMIDSADKLECIFDECHELFDQSYTRQTLEGVVRTARKRNVAIILSSQTLKEYDVHPGTQAILKQAAVKFIFKQDYQDREYLKSAVGLTSAQVDYILNNLGGADKVKSEGGDQNKHRGEVCIVDGKQVCFCKVDYRKKTESLAVETDAKGIKALFKAS